MHAINWLTCAWQISALPRGCLRRRQRVTYVPVPAELITWFCSLAGLKHRPVKAEVNGLIR